MLARIRKFLYRHRYKFIITGVVISGAAFATRYAQQKLLEWQEKEMKEFLERSRRQQHFERNEITCNETIQSLSLALSDTIEKILDINPILDKLHNNPEDKVALWEELKIKSFTRLSVLLYAGTILVIIIRIQVNMIGGYMYQSLDSEDVKVSEELQEDYLSLLQYFLTEGVKELCNLIRMKVCFVMQNEPLKKQLTLVDIEKLFWAIQTAINSDTEDPLSHLQMYTLKLDKLKKSSLINQLINDTEELLGSEEIVSLGTSCVCRGFSRIMDLISESNPFNPNRNAIAKPSTSKQIHPNNNFTDINKISIPLAKVIPIVNGLTNISKGARVTETWIKDFIQIPSLKELGANVYESYSNPS